MRYIKKGKNENNRIASLSLFSKSKKKRINWIFKLTAFSLLLSLILSIFSEIFLTSSNIVFALLLLLIFMFINIFSDMLGLAIVSCQIEELKKENLSRSLYDTSIRLISNSDKVSSILCDVIGDACGILCGVSGSIVSIIITKKISVNAVGSLTIGAIVSSIIVGLTVLFKAISKKYAVCNSVKIVKRISAFLIKFKRKNKK